MAQPRNTPTMTSKPIQIPAMAREMLEDLGDIGIGLGHGYRQPAGNGRTGTPGVTDRGGCRSICRRRRSCHVYSVR